MKTFRDGWRSFWPDFSSAASAIFGWTVAFVVFDTATDAIVFMIQVLWGLR